MCALLNAFHSRDDQAKQDQAEQAKAEAAPAQGQAQPGQRPLRVAILPAPGMTTLYVNAFQTSFAQGEIMITASVSRQEKDEQGPVLALQPQQALAMTPESARRLVQGLTQVLQQYEARFGQQAAAQGPQN